MDKLEEIGELFHNKVVEAAVYFQNEEVVEHKTWHASGDWKSDLFSAWEAAWANTDTVEKVNSTHFVMHSRKYDCTFQSTWQLVPEMKDMYPFEEENYFDGSPLSEYMRTYSFIPIYAVIAYLVVIFSLKAIMSFMKPFDLKWPLALWNLSLSLFSWVGVFRTVPHLLATLNTYGLYHTICTPVCATYGGGATGFWTFLFIISKFPELVDTLFVVLRKKPLIFLHWYHHVTVLLFCWQSYATQVSSGSTFSAMNYSVHAIMYGYYFLKAVNMWPRFIPSWIITLLQLSQMVVGIVVCSLTYHYLDNLQQPCSTSRQSFKSGVFMYFTYFLLFLQILIQLLTAPPRKSKNAEDLKKKKNI